MGDIMLKDLRNYILESDFKIIYLKNKLDIVNYECIDHFSTDKIMVRYSDGVVIVKGEGLIISKLLDDEILVSGFIKNIEFK